MKNRLLIALAPIAMLGVPGSSLADGPYATPEPVVVEVVPFSWSGCYGGVHVGGAWADTRLTDPVQLVQDQVLGPPPVTTGVTTVSTNVAGWLFGGQVGCDHQFASHWVVGLEGTLTASTVRGDTRVALPLGNPGEQASITTRVDNLPSVSARLGYAWDRWLFYAKAGGAWADDSYKITGTLQGAPFVFQGSNLRTGWLVGGGVERAIGAHWSVRLEYDYYDFGRGNVLMTDSALSLSGTMDAKQTVQAVRLGLNFHPW
jgi:outer membrane immunogenic protein